MKTPKDYIVFPLDLPDYDQAMGYVETLKESVGLFKVGLELFISQGPKIINAIRAVSSAGIFLDLKLHDIPATVQRAFSAASVHKPDFVSVHCDEGSEILKSVAENNPGNTKILAITVLTSLNQVKLKALGYRDEYASNISALVLQKALLAQQAGCHGVVCSGLEVGMVKKTLGTDLLAVTPGIRPAWTLVDKDDQQRIVTPAAAVGNGSDFVVIGRPIRDAKDPREAAERVAEEIASAL